MLQNNNSNKTILVVDDDELIVNLIRMNLQMEGYNVVCAYKGRDALKMVNEFPPDMVILDIMMPEMDGFEVCQALQGRGIPIIMLTAKSSIEDKIKGLELGADDYVVKPFDGTELIARVNGLFRRFDMSSESLAGDMSGIYVDKEGHRVLVDGEEINLTPREFDLLTFLMSTPDKVFSREKLLETVWGYEYLGDSRTVDMHVQRVRKKIGKYRNNILTVFGVGYKFQEIVK